MAKKELSKKMGLIGIGFGLIMFAVYGLFQGALIGGTAGLKLGCYLMGGGAAGANLLVRGLAAVGMLTGVLLSAAMFVTSGFAAGRIVGFVANEGPAVEKAGEVPRAVH